MLFASYTSDALSSSAVGDQETETGLIDVHIEPGSRPLYLVLTSGTSIIWRVDGAVSRIASLVVSSGRGAKAKSLMGDPTIALPSMAPLIPPQNQTGSLSGVVGIARRRVCITNTDCPRAFSGVTGLEPSASIEAIRLTTGRSPDVVYAGYQASRAVLARSESVWIHRGAVF